MPIKEDFANSFMKGRISGFLSIFLGVASFYLPGDKFPKEYGVNMPNYPKGFLPQFVYPFRAK